MKLKNIGSNQTQIVVNGVTILFSYNTAVAAQMANGDLIRSNKKWSVTTSKHINAWLGDSGIQRAKSVEQSVLDALA
jgi:hypothetical protein